MDINKILQKRLNIFESEALKRIQEAETDAKGAMEAFKSSVKAFREELERISTLKLVGSAIELFEESDGNIVLIPFSGSNYKQRHGGFAVDSLNKILEDIIEEDYHTLHYKRLDLGSDYNILIIPLRKKVENP